MGVPVTAVDPQLPTVTGAAVGRRDGVRPRRPTSAPSSTGRSPRTSSWASRRCSVEDPAAFRARLAPLAEVATTPTAPPAVEGDDVPFVLVLPGLDLNDVAPAMRRGTQARRQRHRPRRGADLPTAPGRRGARGAVPAVGRRHRLGALQRPARGRAGDDHRPRPHPADHRRGRGARRRASRHAATEQVLLAAGARARAPTSGCRPCGSASGARSSAGAGTATRTRGSVRRPRPTGSCAPTRD